MGGGLVWWCEGVVSPRVWGIGDFEGDFRAGGWFVFGGPCGAFFWGQESLNPTAKASTSRQSGILWFPYEYRHLP